MKRQQVKELIGYLTVSTLAVVVGVKCGFIPGLCVYFAYLVGVWGEYD